MSMTPETIIPGFGFTELLQMIQEIPESLSEHITFPLKISNIGIIGKDACRTILEIRLTTSWKS